MEALRALRPALVVADFAPTALMAARASGIATVAVGASFGLPPAGLTRFPEILTRDQAALLGEFSDSPAPDEDAVCACVNDTLGPLGVPPLAHLTEVYAADLSMPQGVLAWDPYAASRTGPLVLPFDTLPPLSRGSGKEVFIYFAGDELKEAAVQDALIGMPFEATLVAPSMSAELAQRLAVNPRLTLAAKPLSREDIVRRSRVILCAGQAGTLALGVLTGVPVVALPTHHEQLSNAVRAAELLTGVRLVPKATRSAEAIIDAVRTLWDQPAVSAAARLVALDLREAYEGSALDVYRKAILPLL